MLTLAFSQESTSYPRVDKVVAKVMELTEQTLLEFTGFCRNGKCPPSKGNGAGTFIRAVGSHQLVELISDLRWSRIVFNDL